jgi:hypothetical protein
MRASFAISRHGSQKYNNKTPSCFIASQCSVHFVCVTKAGNAECGDVISDDIASRPV